MRRSLTRKLDYEKAKLKSKAAKPPFRDRIIEEGDKFDRGGSPDEHITIADAAKGDYSKILRDDKMKAMQTYEQKLRGLPVRVEKWIYKFKDTRNQFAKQNGISIREAEKLLPFVLEEANGRLQMTLGRMRNAGLEPHVTAPDKSGKPRGVWRLRFKTFLPTVEPVEWSKIYKRIEICPMDQETDG